MIAQRCAATFAVERRCRGWLREGGCVRGGRFFSGEMSPAIGNIGSGGVALSRLRYRHRQLERCQPSRSCSFVNVESRSYARLGHSKHVSVLVLGLSVFRVVGGGRLACSSALSCTP